MARIALLYKIEAQCAEMSSEERREVRDQQNRQIIDGIFERLEELKTTTLPSEPLRKAIDYALNHRLLFIVISKTEGQSLIITRLKTPSVLWPLAEKTGCSQGANEGRGQQLYS
jgi:hypothetical protein